MKLELGCWSIQELVRSHFERLIQQRFCVCVYYVPGTVGKWMDGDRWVDRWMEGRISRYMRVKM